MEGLAKENNELRVTKVAPARWIGYVTDKAKSWQVP
jgi:hypothetical protein